MPKITPFLWFDSQAEEAANFYTSLFPNSKIITITRFGGEAANMAGKPPGSVMTVVFELDGQTFTALNGGPIFKFTEAISLLVNCESQNEIDFFWDRLSQGGEKGRCGWLKDKFGLSWQIVPSSLGQLLQSSDPERAKRVSDAIMQMDKLDVVTLEKAAAGV